MKKTYIACSVAWLRQRLASLSAVPIFLSLVLSAFATTVELMIDVRANTITRSFDGHALAVADIWRVEI